MNVKIPRIYTEDNPTGSLTANCPVDDGRTPYSKKDFHDVIAGHILASYLDGNIVNKLLNGVQAQNKSLEEDEAAYLKTLEEQAREKNMDVLNAKQWIREQLKSFRTKYVCERPRIVGTLDGVRYESFWSKGELYFSILHSPLIILQKRRHVVRVYSVPLQWFK